ncbi:hypothetical protein [Rhizobium glycinendophyticum]|uniref:Uncharacterized protein n=1 Tax=Rhizobium glycinendophyticum TaxID=2589807 RepID=A0A504US29_9HYPH|nr:hypothetical protein [Rhizobium glycinendophyticum]TPP11516.1 hypothetical protein FJQ55_12140 [Rhizobium glycinendophyticum]
MAEPRGLFITTKFRGYNLGIDIDLASRLVSANPKEDFWTSQFKWHGPVRTRSEVLGLDVSSPDGPISEHSLWSFAWDISEDLGETEDNVENIYKEMMDMFRKLPDPDNRKRSLLDRIIELEYQLEDSRNSTQS